VRARLEPHQLSKIVRRHVERLARARGMPAGDATLYANRFSSHSMRRGAATSMAEAGLSLGVMRARMRHSNNEELARYIAAAEAERCTGLAGLVPAKAE
jgi:integrase